MEKGHKAGGWGAWAGAWLAGPGAGGAPTSITNRKKRRMPMVNAMPALRGGERRQGAAAAARGAPFQLRRADGCLLPAHEPARLLGLHYALPPSPAPPKAPPHPPPPHRMTTSRASSAWIASLLKGLVAQRT
jgi:hypothetical protein